MVGVDEQRPAWFGGEHLNAAPPDGVEGAAQQVLVVDVNKALKKR